MRGHTRDSVDLEKLPLPLSVSDHVDSTPDRPADCTKGLQRAPSQLGFSLFRQIRWAAKAGLVRTVLRVEVIEIAGNINANTR